MESQLIIDAIRGNRKLAPNDTADLKSHVQFEMGNAYAQFSLLRERWSREKTSIPSPSAGTAPMADIPDSSVHDRRNSSGSAATHAPISKNPKFSIDRYVHCEVEIGLWMDAHSYVDDPALISEITLQAEANSVFRTVIAQLTKSTAGTKHGR